MTQKLPKLFPLLSLLFSYGVATEIPKLQKEFEQSKQKEQGEFYGEPNTQNSSLQTTKTSCIQQSVYAGKTLEEQKKILIEQAKQESLEELYGTLILTSTDLKNGKITNDEIKTRAVGSVRVKGDPKFYNGQNLGEICANVTSYITKEDLEKYTPKEVKLKDFCFSDSSVAIKEVKNKARESAYKEMLVQFKPALKTLSKEEAEKYIHGFKESNGNFDFDKGAYCFDAVGTVLPYELEISAGSNKAVAKVPKEDNKPKIYKSCNDVKTASPDSKSGLYEISIDDKKLMLHCEMEIDGGGWTKVWESKINNHNDKDFNYDVPFGLIDKQKEVIMAFSYKERLEMAYKFDMPRIWKYQHPLSSKGNIELVDAMDLYTGRNYTNVKLFFGYENFSAYCGDSFSGGLYGKICIADTNAPFYTGFSVNENDFCNSSVERYSTHRCDYKSFVIYMR